ncbi:PD40 domain-containing protein [candidate division KSB1 bacterium]|nr:PD40 domain-containing protein [candidate division KSB1 bacterium]
MMLQNRIQVILFLFLIQIPMGQAQYYFGRNKIQYNQFEWQVLRTEHFDIYYYPEMESLAEIGAAHAESSYSHLQDKFNHEILRRIPLIFYSSHFHFEETNTLPYLIPQGLGGFFEFLKGRVVVPSDGSISRFKHTIRHELVHVFMRGYVSQITRDHPTNRYSIVPLWFTEGLAEYWSEGWSAEAEMIIRDGILNNRLVPIDKLGYIAGTFLMYKEGQAVLRHIAETYGEDKILRIMDNVWKGRSFSEVLRITLGKDAKTLSEEWIYTLKKSKYPLLADQDMPRMVSLRVTDKGYNTQSAFYQNDTLSTVVFMANRDGYSSIYQKPLADFKTHKPEILIRGERSADWESFHLQKSRIDVHPNGLLVFVAKSGAQDVLYIYSIPDRKILHKLDDPNLVSLFSPAWSPVGEWIAFAGLDHSGKRDLYRIRISDGYTEQLTNDHFDDMDPDWSPDGEWLVFSSDRTESGQNGSSNLFLYHLESHAIRYLTTGPFEDTSPAWSPDGRFIAFSSDRNDVPNLWVANPETETALSSDSLQLLIQVTAFATGAFYPAWTDSSGLLFTAFENFGFQIRHIDDIPSRIQDVIPSKLNEPDTRSGPWAFSRISGRMQTEKVKYKRHFSLDFAQSQVVQDPIYGTSGGGQLAISDLLGNEKYYFLIYNNARTRSEFWNGFNLSATRVDLSHRINYAVGLYRLAGLYFNYYEGFFTETRHGGMASLSYPLNKFQRIETSVNIRNSFKEWYGTEERRKALLVSNFVSYTHDNSLWGPTGPLDGSRYKITLGNTVDIQHSNVNFTTVIVDLRKYYRIGYRMCYAVRMWGEFNQGRESLPFFMGGSWDLRGYKLWSLWGPKLVLLSNEFRFPLLDQFYLGFPFGGVGFNSIRGALFVDAGNVWEDQLTRLLGSFGFGIRLGLGGYLVLRYDVGKRTDFQSIDPSTFRQFFFGVDF